MKTLGEPLAHGRMAQIYDWDETHILKLFRDSVGYHEAQREAQHEASISQVICALGAPAPHPGEIIEIDARVGLLYEKIPGATMTTIVLKDASRLLPMAQLMARLHRQIHTLSPGEKFPHLKAQITDRLREAYLPRELRHKAILALQRLPAGAALCHGDFHTENILIDGPRAAIIDWPNATSGNPLADVARTSIVLLGAVHTLSNLLNKIALRWFHFSYLKAYFNNQTPPAEYYAWLPIIAAARLDENIDGQHDFLLAEAAKLGK